MKRWKVVVFTACVLFIYGSLASATEVFLYTEGGLLPSQNQLLVRVYADITDDANGGPLLSAGFVLHYGNGLTNPVAEKNTVDWYFGTPDNQLPSIEPDTSREGEVVFLLGKLDENCPSQGISGNRVLLGSVLFDYSGSNPKAADIGLADGHTGSFSDFVTTEGIVLDTVVSYSIAEFAFADDLKLQGVTRALQVLTRIETNQPVRIAPDDITEDGKIGINDPIYQLKQMAQ